MRKFPANPRLETERLLMRTVETSDLEDFMSVHGDAHVVRFTPHGPWKTAADGRAWFKRMLKYRASGKTLQLAILDKATGKAIGIMLLFNVDENARKGEVGYMLARKHWGKGLASEALVAFVDHCFKKLKLARLDAQLDPRNAASAKVLVKAGFTHEGHQRRNHFAKGEISDTGLYGLLRGDKRPKR